MMYTLDPLLPVAVNMMQLKNEYPLLQELRLLLNTCYYICHQLKHEKILHFAHSIHLCVLCEF